MGVDAFLISLMQLLAIAAFGSMAIYVAIRIAKITAEDKTARGASANATLQIKLRNLLNIQPVQKD